MSVTAQTSVFGPGRTAPPATVGRQVPAQRRDYYPRDALRARARSHQARPRVHLQRMLADFFTALGGCLSLATLDEFAGGIPAGRALRRGGHRPCPW